MPKFRLNKLVRDGLKQKYAALGQQAKYPKLSRDEHIKLLIEKIIEEVKEIPINGTVKEIAYEIGDVQQGINDLRSLFGVTEQEVEAARQEVFKDKKGFAGGTYVGTLTLKDGDSWVDYYRSDPNRFPEITEDER